MPNILTTYISSQFCQEFLFADEELPHGANVESVIY